MAENVEMDGWNISSEDENTSTADITSVLTASDQTDTPVSDDTPAPDTLDDTHAERAAGAEDDAPKAEAKPETPADDPAKREPTAKERKGEAQARINAAVREQREAERRAAAKDEELAALRAELQAAKAGTPPAKPSPVALTDAQVASMPSWQQYQDDGKEWDEYARDHAAWLRAANTEAVESKIAEREQKIIERVRQEESERSFRQAREREYEEIRARHAAYVEQHPDVEEARKNLEDIDQTPFLAAIVNFHPSGPAVYHHWATHPAECKALSQIDTLPALMAAIRVSDDPVPLLAHVANTPGEIARLAAMAPEAALLHLGKMQSRLDGAKTGSPSVVPVTRAAAPIRPVVGGRSSGDRDDDGPVDESTDFSAWLKADSRRERRASAAH